MADRINFSNKINDSVQAGDELYYSTVSGSSISTPTFIGEISNLGENYVEVASAGGATANNFFMFRKPVGENVSSLKGYYAEATFTNSSLTKQELFAVGSEITISSK